MEEYQYTFDFGLLEIPFFHIDTHLYLPEKQMANLMESKQKIQKVE